MQLLRFLEEFPQFLPVTEKVRSVMELGRHLLTTTANGKSSNKGE